MHKFFVHFETANSVRNPPPKWKKKQYNRLYLTLPPDTSLPRPSPPPAAFVCDAHDLQTESSRPSSQMPPLGRLEMPCPLPPPSSLVKSSKIYGEDLFGHNVRIFSGAEISKKGYKMPVALEWFALARLAVPLVKYLEEAREREILEVLPVMHVNALKGVFFSFPGMEPLYGGQVLLL